MRHNSGMQAKEDGDAFAIVRVELEDGGVCMEAMGTAEEAACPSCGARAAAVHGRYQRHPRDLPWRRWHVRLAVTVRRFRCPNPQCPRTTFAETFGTGLPRYARRTAEVTDALQTFALGGGGEAGARLATKARLPASPDTLLRLIRQADVATTPTPRVLGVDDFALRRGHRYGTLLIDLETHRPVDVLDERTADGLATWLKTHPGVEVIARDRAEAYAEGARAGAPNAVQVADRFHLLQNASAALDEVLRGRTRRLEVLANAATKAADPGPAPAVAPPPPSRAEQRRRAARERRVARWEEVRARHAAGETLSGIARALGLDRKTVRRWLGHPDPPAAKGRPPRPPDLASPALQPYLTYLQERWQAGCTNISQLYREIAAQGFTKSRSLVAQALLAWRGPRPAPAPRRPDGSWQRGRPRQRRMKVRWLCLRPPEQLDADERAALDRVLADDATLKTGYDLLQRFRQVVTDRDVAALGTWLADAQASDMAPFVTLANGIVADRAAVDAALTTPWSTGPVEGHVHRVKLLKRQHYGRAKLDLLRARVLMN